MTPGSSTLATEPEIQGKTGRIYPYSADLLAVHVGGVKRLHKLARQPGAVLFTEGGNEGVVQVPNELLDVAVGVIEAPKM